MRELNKGDRQTDSDTDPASLEDRLPTPATRQRQVHLLPLDGEVAMMLTGFDDLGDGDGDGDTKPDHVYSLYLPLSDLPDLNASKHHRTLCDDRTANTIWICLHFLPATLSEHVQCGFAESMTLASAQVLHSTSSILQGLARMVRHLYALQDQDAEALHGSAREVAARQLLKAVLSVVAIAEYKQRKPRGRRPLQRQEVIGKCLDLIAANPGQHLSIEDLCAAAGVSDRTLRTVFLEQFGLSPHRYLMTRRVHAIHRALCNASEGETVTSLCSDHGVWDFGRFAQQYRQVYGVLPSQDLYASTGRARVAAVSQASLLGSDNKRRRRRASEVSTLRLTDKP